jgi:hypothetical protein
MITASILDYLGKFEGGILVSVGLMYEGNFYNGIFYYTTDKMIITVDDNFRESFGNVEELESYLTLMESIINMVEPYESIIDDLKDYEPLN